MRTIHKIALTLTVILLQSVCAFAQEDLKEIRLSLSQCIEMARSRNLNLQLAKQNVASSEVNLSRSKANYLPTINGGVSYQRNFGTTFNALTFQRSNVETDFSSPRVTLTQNLYSSFRNYYKLNESIYSLEASAQALKNSDNELVLSVFSSFLQIIFDEQNIKLQAFRIDLVRNQLNRSKRRLDAGAGAVGDVLSLESRLSNEEVQMVSFQNQLERDKLALAQILQLPFDQRFSLTDPSIESFEPIELPKIEEVRESAHNIMPSIKEQNFKLLSAEYSIKLARSAYLPTLSFSAGLNSQYTSQTNSFFFDQNRTGYFNQIKDAFQQTVALQINIPILNGLDARTNVELAKVSYEIQRLNLDLTKLQVDQNIQKAWLDASLAQKQLNAMRVQREVQQKNLSLAEKQYEAGAMDFLNLNEILNNMYQVNIQEIQAKYDLVFKYNILMLYLGQPITF